MENTNKKNYHMRGYKAHCKGMEAVLEDNAGLVCGHLP